MRAPRTCVAALGAFAMCGGAFAMEQCRSLPGEPPTSPCATIAQVVVWLILPVVLAATIVFLARRFVRRAWLQFAIASVSVVAGVGWELFAFAILQGWVAPCSASCWY